MMVEATEDVMDMAVLDDAKTITHAKQVKTRTEAYTWGKSELVEVLRHWAKLEDKRPKTPRTLSPLFQAQRRYGDDDDQLRLLDCGRLSLLRTSVWSMPQSGS